MSSLQTEAAAPRQQSFCGHCGAPLGAAAHVCPHCGAALSGPTPVTASFAATSFAATASVATASVATAPAPAPPGPGAPSWPRQALLTGQIGQGRRRLSRFSQLPPMAKLVLLFVGLVLAGALVQAVLPGQHRCIYACGPSKGPLAPDAHTYPTTAAAVATLGFSFGYPASMVLTSNQYGSEVALAEPDGGELFVWSGHGQQQLEALVQATEQRIGLPIQEAQPAGAVPGAEIGFSPGQGEFFCANSDQLGPVLWVVVVAQSPGTWAAVAGYTPNAPDAAYLCNWKSGFGNQDVMGFDDVLARWQWAGR